MCRAYDVLYFPLALGLGLVARGDDDKSGKKSDGGKAPGEERSWQREWGGAQGENEEKCGDVGQGLKDGPATGKAVSFNSRRMPDSGRELHCVPQPPQVREQVRDDNVHAACQGWAAGRGHHARAGQA